MVWPPLWVDITSLSKEGQVFKFVSVKASRYINSLTSYDNNLLTCLMKGREEFQ